MLKKYIKIALIPAFFACFFAMISCTKKDTRIEVFKNFASTDHDITEITKGEPDEEYREKEFSEKAELDFIKRYHIGYLTFDVADIYMEVKPLRVTEEYTKYRTRIYSRTNGIVDYFMGWLSHTVGYTRVYDDHVIPERFRSKVKHKKKTRNIELVFDPSGKKFTKDKVTPPDNRRTRPAVTDEEKFGAYDPISGFFETRRLVKNAFKYANFNDKGFYTFTVPVYDGRRRTDFLFTLLEKEQDNGFYKLSVRLEPVAGYTEKELDRDEGSSYTSLTFMLDTQNYMPVEIIGKHPLGTASAEFVENCKNVMEKCIEK